jgi:hypothetical protein
VVGDDADLGHQALRLALSAELTHRAGRALGGPLAADADADALVAAAARLAAIAAPVERAHRLRFTPAYPGVTAGVVATGGARRLVLACSAHDAGGAPAAVIYTTLIAGRPAQVTAAPAAAAIPDGWRALEPP